MDLQLQDQHVLITGGSKGIGLACALGFLREGARVSLVSRDLQNLQQGQQSLTAAFPQAEGRVGWPRPATQALRRFAGASSSSAAGALSVASRSWP